MQEIGGGWVGFIIIVIFFYVYKVYFYCLAEIVCC